MDLWVEFAHETAKLKRTAVSIGKSVHWLAKTRAEYNPVSDEDEFPEVPREAEAVTLKEQRTLKRPDFSSLNPSFQQQG
ncbi:MAG: hypothetical protein HYR94_07575 [Chloroflexi bacterium]|nr:hypothetical protein [Chloroflexota bacterium]